MAKKFPPFMGKETKAEEVKEMKVKAKSPAMYKKGEKAEGVHGKSGMEKPTKYAKGDGVESKGKTNCETVKMAMGGRTPRVGMAPPRGMVRPSMTPEGGAAIANAIKGMGKRSTSPEDQARAEQMMARAGIAKPQFNPADADKIRARMSEQAAKQNRPMGMAPRPRMGMAAGGAVKTFAKGGGCEVKGKTKGKFI